MGMPAIVNFRERKLLKMIYELRDKENFQTHTYIVNKMTGTPVYLCPSMGYAINDATGFTNPDKVIVNSSQSYGTLPQAEPNGLFTPSSSNAYWVICMVGGKPSPIFVASEVLVTPVKL